MIEFDAENFNDFIQMLYTKQDIKYKTFNDKIVNGVGESIGIRIPDLRKVAKEISKSEKNIAMLELLHQHHLYEIRMIEGILIGLIKTTQETSQTYIESFVENRVDNWALCDCFAMNLKTKVKQNETWFYKKSKYYAVSEKTWEIRFGLVMFLCYFKEKSYFSEIQEIILNIKSPEYYVKMAAAWLISVLYIDLKNETLELIKNPRLDVWIRNKAIQKIRESYRVSADDKNALIALKLNQLSK
jgi:3-methyladenine DNA glycosylase AlkD